jgi:cobalt-zinc-cadmium efflux system membrane fusion protein
MSIALRSSRGLPLLLSLGVALLFTLPARFALAQLLPLDSGDIERLDIRFATPAPVQPSDGLQVPASVINAPDSQLAVSARHTGVLEHWLAAPGEPVGAGQQLAVIRSDSIARLQQDWIAADTGAAQADAALARDRALLDAGIIARQRLEQTEREAQQAQFRRRALAAQLEAAGFDAAARARLRSGELAPGQYFAVAPDAGVLARRALDVGAVVVENASLAVLSQSSALWLRAEVPAAAAAALAPGQRLATLGGHAPLALRYKDANVDALTQRVQISAEFLAPPGLLPGQIVTLVLPSTRAGMLVPSAAVVRHDGLTTVFVRTDGGVEVRPLALVPMGEAYLATEGLRSEEQVVVKGSALLKGMLLGLGESAEGDA